MKFGNFVSRILLCVLLFSQLSPIGSVLAITEGNVQQPAVEKINSPSGREEGELSDKDKAKDEVSKPDADASEKKESRLPSGGENANEAPEATPDPAKLVSSQSSEQGKTTDANGGEKNTEEMKSDKDEEDKPEELGGVTYSFRSAGTDRASVGPKEHYGVVRAKLDTFAYYEIPNVTSNNGEYHWYGAGLDIFWQLPKEAKEGDYFTLKLPPEVELDQAPIYGDDEQVDYRKLDEIAGEAKRFFQIKTGATAVGGAGIPILNVYYTKHGELVFVAQKYVNDKDAIAGNAIIGRPVDTGKLVAFTDGNGRHYRDRKHKANYGSSSAPQSDDLDKQLGSGRTYYEGFRPNKLLMSAFKGATARTSNPNFLSKTIYYTTSYNGLTEFRIEDSANVNYQTELYKKWSYNSFGETTIYPVREDKDYVYYNLIYNANRNIGRAWFGRRITLDLENKSLRLEKPEDIRIYSGYTDKYDKAPVESIVPSMAWYPDAVVKDKSFVQERGLQNTYTLSLSNGETVKTYFAELKLRKVKMVPDNEGKLGYKVSLKVNDATYRREYDDFYHPTQGLGEGVSIPKPPSAVLYPALKITKTDDQGRPVIPRLKTTPEGKVLYSDVFGNTYTWVDGTTDQYRRSDGTVLTQKRDGSNNLVFENESGDTFISKEESGQSIYVDKHGFTYRKEKGTDKYVSKDQAKEVKTPVDFSIQTSPLKFIANGEELTVFAYSVWYDQYNQRHLVENLISKNGDTYEVDIIDKGGGNIEIYSMIFNGRQMTIQKTGDPKRITFDDIRKVAPVPGFELIRPVLSTDGVKELQDLGLSYVTIFPQIEDPFKFSMRDMETGDVFEHEVNESGQAVFPSLLKGHTYELQETRSSAGYKLDPEKYRVVVSENSTVTVTKADGTPITKDTSPLAIQDEGTITFTMKNERTTTLAIRKVDDGDQQITTEPATFKLYSPGEYVKDESGKITILDGAKGITFETTQKGSHGLSEAKKVTPIANGVYILVEEKAPSGYEKLDQNIELQLVAQAKPGGDEQTLTWKVLTPTDRVSLEADGLTVKVKNKKVDTDYKLKVLKKDYHTEAGLDAEISLYKAILNEKGEIQRDAAGIKKELIAAKHTTDQPDNSASFENLKPGTYVLVETKAPDGYQKRTQEYVLTIGQDGKVNLEKPDNFVALKGTTDRTIELTIKNLKNGEYPKTGGTGIMAYLLVGGILAGLGLWGYHYRTKRRW